MGDRSNFGRPGTRTKYAYDAAGNTLSDSTDTDTYNDAGRLKTVTNTSGTTTFLYNALGQMIEANGPSGTVLYVYDQGGHLLGEYDGAGNLIQETVWLGDIPVATIQPSGSSVAIYYVVTDQLSTPREVVRPSDNTVMWSWFTGPFGTEAPNTNPQGAGTFTYDLRLPGQIAGAWGSTFQNGHRDYDPAVGRYIESDPIGLAGGSYSTYAYVGDNPISHIDPLGLCDQDETARCKQVKEDAIEQCSALLPTTDFGFQFWNCVNQYIEDHGCGPGGTPLPQPVSPAPAPQLRTPRTPNETSPAPNLTTTAAILAALYAVLRLLPYSL